MKLLTQWAVTSSVLILIVLAARYLFRDKLSARLKYALWGVVLLRLLVPFQVELPANTSAALPVLASNLAQDVSPRLEDTMLYAVPTERRPSDRVQPGEQPEYSRTLHSEANREYYSGGVVYDGNGITRYFFMMPASELLMMIWKTGAGLCLLVILYSNWGFSLRLDRRRRKLEVQDAPIPVYVAEGLSSPCLFGVLRPAVYVTPQAAENPDTLRHVLAHELTHYAHFDHIWSLLRVLALALHWYNPLVWLAVWLSKGDGELACDEGAVARLGEEDRVPYGRTLVDMVAARSSRPGDLLSCSTAMTGGGKSIQRRVVQIVKKPETVKAALFAAVAVVALAVVFVFAGREPASEVNQTLLDHLERTTAIHYSPPLHSSTIYPNPITKEDLLAQAKEALRSAAPLGPDDPEPDRDTLLYASTASLALEDGSEVYYTLLQQDGYTYVLEGAVQYWYEETQQDPWYSAAFRSEKDIISILKSLARQDAGGGIPTAPGYEHYHVLLEAARAVWFNGTMLHNGYVLTDTKSLEQLKELLVLTRVSDPPEWDGLWSDSIAFSTAAPGPDWTGADASNGYYIVPTDEEFYYVCSGGEDGCILGKLSKDSWEQARKLLSEAPTVDDRQHQASNATYEGFLNLVEGAVSIRYSPQPTISTVYPEPITDPRLLALAGEKLCRFVLPEENNTPPDPKKLMESSRIVLSDGTRETTYTLVAWNDWTWLIPGDALSQYLSLEEGEVLEYGPIFRSQVRSDMIPGIASLAQMQEFLSQDPAFPVPMTRDELGKYSLADICQTLGYQLQGWSGDPEDTELVSGYITPERVQLMYFGDETHLGLWMLELLAPEISAHSSGYTVVSDQPSAVFSAARYQKSWSGWSGYEMMPPETFAACLEPEDVVSVTAGDYDPGQEISLDLPALKDQLTQALYHQFSTEYDREKHGQYVLTVRVKGSGRELYDGHEIAEDADRLTLSAGSEKDVVCLSHRNFSATPEPTRVFVRSPELYRAIRNLFD